MSIQLWKNKATKEVEPKLFSTLAEEQAKQLSNDGKDSKGKDKLNKSSQLRRFFDEVVRLNDMAKSRQKPVPMSLVLPSLHMLIAKASYAQGRDLVSPSFVTLMRDSIAQIQDREDLQVFTHFFEAVIAFYKLYRPKD